jgi:hypothetical protein
MDEAEKAELEATVLRHRASTMAWVESELPQSAPNLMRLKAVAKTQMDLGYAALLLLLKEA